MGVWVVCMTRNSDDVDVSFRTPLGDTVIVCGGTLGVGCRLGSLSWWLNEHGGELTLTPEARRLAKHHGYDAEDVGRVLGRLEAHYDQGDFTLEPPAPECFIVALRGKCARGWVGGSSEWYDQEDAPRAIVTVEGYNAPHGLGQAGKALDELLRVAEDEIGLDRITPPEPDRTEGRIAGGPAWTTDPDAEVYHGDLVLKGVTERGLENLECGRGTGPYLKSVVRVYYGYELRDGEVLLKVSSARRDESNVPAGYWRDLGIDPGQTWEYGGKTYRLKDEKLRVPGMGEVFLSWHGRERDWGVVMRRGVEDYCFNEHPEFGERRPILEPVP